MILIASALEQRFRRIGFEDIRPAGATDVSISVDKREKQQAHPRKPDYHGSFTKALKLELAKDNQARVTVPSLLSGDLLVTLGEPKPENRSIRSLAAYSGSGYSGSGYSGSGYSGAQSHANEKGAILALKT